MEGVIQYRLLGDHPAASGRYLTLGFPGVATSRDKIVEQVIQEHRINTSRYKLEVRKLVGARDAPGFQPGAASPPPPEGGGNDENGNIAGTSRDSTVPVVLHGNEELHTYDRLTIHVSKRQLADDDAARKEEEQLERQRRVQEMEEELLVTTTTSSAPPQRTGGMHSGTPPPSSSSQSPLPPPQSHSTRHAARTPAVDPLRLARAAALASQLFPILKGQHGGLTSLEDPANTHHCVLCRLPAFGEMLTSCCRFCVCASCYASAAEMDMEEGRCPVCGTKTAIGQKDNSGDAALEGDGVSSRGGQHKRPREASGGPLGSWKREGTEDSKEALQRSLRGTGDNRLDNDRSASASTTPGRRDVAASSSASSAAMSKEVVQIEKRLQQDLERAFAVLEGPDMLSAAAKEKRVIGAELAALCEL